MSERPSLAATRRTATGKQVAKLRLAGQLPAVVIGHGVDSALIALDAHEFELLRRHAGGTTLIDLVVDGGARRPVLIHGLQVHPVNRRPLHVDLLAVRMSEAMTVDVAIAGTGHAPATDLGGTVMHTTETVKIRALPGNLPEAIHYDLGALGTMESTVTVADLQVPDGVTVLTDAAEIIARVLPPRVDEAEAATGEGEAVSGDGAGDGGESAAGAPDGAPASGDGDATG